MQLAGASHVSLVGRFYDRLRAARWRALKIARAMSRVPGKHDIEFEVLFYRLQFPFTVPNLWDCAAGAVLNSYPDVDPP
jgi:hypothetical protein